MKDEVFEHQLLLFQGHILIMLTEYQQSGNPRAEGILLEILEVNDKNDLMNSFTVQKKQRCF